MIFKKNLFNVINEFFGLNIRSWKPMSVDKVNFREILIDWRLFKRPRRIFTFERGGSVFLF